MSAFRERDVVRLLRAAQKAGLPVVRVVVDPTTGKITIEAGESPGQDSARDASAVAAERIAAMRRGAG